MKNSIEAGLPAKTTDRRISRTLLDCTKRLFSGNEKNKTTKKRAYTALIIFPLYFYRYTHISFGETPILFGKTLYNLAKLSGFARLYGVLPNCFTFAKSYEVLPKGFTFAKLYPTFAKSFILFGKRTPEQKFALFRM